MRSLNMFFVSSLLSLLGGATSSHVILTIPVHKQSVTITIANQNENTRPD
jgi:hypothetical protein